MSDQTEKTIDQLAQDAKREKMGRAVLTGGIAVYVIALVVGVIRNLELFGGTFRQTGYEWIGLLGVAALGINALVLPLFLHYRASGAQFLATLIFYGVDLAILFVNAIIDARQVQQVTVTGIAAFYYDNILFATPVVVMMGWAILFMLDPASGMERAMIEARGLMLTKLKSKIEGASRAVNVDQTIEAHARAYTTALAEKLLPVSEAGKPSNGTSADSGIFSLNESAERVTTKRAPKAQASSDREPVAVKPSRNGHGANPLA